MKLNPWKRTFFVDAVLRGLAGGFMGKSFGKF